jgi:hypothetical protein
MQRGGRPGGPGGKRPERGGVAVAEAAPPTPQIAKPKTKAIPAAHLTDKMRQGKEPLRTFGDLLQLISEKPADDNAAES